MGLLGGVGAILLAWPVIPSSGQMVMIENKEHFSPWHLYLLFATLPTLAAVIAVIFWLPESPTFLLEHGREVEALTIYQVTDIHTFYFSSILLMTFNYHFRKFIKRIVPKVLTL